MPEPPIVTVRDVRSWPGVFALSAAALIALAVDRLLLPLPEAVVVLAGVMLTSFLVIAVVGAREIQVFESEIVVSKRGRVVRRLPLRDLIAIGSPGAGLQILKFRGGATLWWTPLFEEGGHASDYLASVLERNLQQSLSSESSSSTLVPLGALRFDPSVCVACGSNATLTRPLVARRGLNGIVFSSFTVREVHVPVCRRCNRRRMVTGLLLPLLPASVSALSFQFDPVPYGAPWIGLWLAVNLTAWALLANLGYRAADYTALGIALGTLDSTHARVPVYRRARRTAGQSRGPGA